MAFRLKLQPLRYIETSWEAAGTQLLEHSDEMESTELDNLCEMMDVAHVPQR